MLEDLYYQGIVKFLAHRFGIDDYTLIKCADFEFGTFIKCRVYCGFCIMCWECIDGAVDSCLFDGKCHQCGECED